MLAGKAKQKAAETEERYVPPELPRERIVEKLMQKVSCPLQALAML